MRIKLVIFFLLFAVFGFANDSTQRQNTIVEKLVNTDHASDADGARIEKKKMTAVDYVPEIHGTVRAKYEYCPQLDASRFQVRNARFSVTGNVHQMVAYKAEVELSDRGQTRILDTYVRVLPVKGLALTLGQVKKQFSTDNLRSPHNMLFANPAFIVSEFANLRDVGFTAGYNAKEYVPIEAILGAYNGNGLYDQKIWKKHFDYSARLIFNTCKYFAFDLNWQSIKPENIRMNVFDLAMRADFYGVHLEAEGAYKIYQNNVFKPSYGFTGTAYYDIMLPKVFHHLRVLGRYDMITDDYDGSKLIEEGVGTIYPITTSARQRITAGVTLSLADPILAELRINYEKYFHKDWSAVKADDQDKLVIEIVARF